MPSSQTSVIVVGAGLAGLAAALALHRAGVRVSVLEARDRVGGRVFTWHSGFQAGQHAEAGGEFIDEDHLRMRALARESGLALDPVRGTWTEGGWAAFDGRLAPETEKKAWGLPLRAAIDQIWAALAELGRSVPDPAWPLSAPQAAALDAQSAADWLDLLAPPRLARLGFEARLRSEYTVEARRFSLLDLARNAALFYSQPGAAHPTYRLRAGNDALPRALAAALPDVRLSAPAVHIRAHSAGVAVTYRAGGALDTVSADAVILAIPLTTARQLTFEPALPPAHQAMVHGVSYGTVTKVLIQYRRRWWPALGWNGRLSNDAPLATTWDATGEQPGEPGLLTVYTGGAPGAAYAALSDAERMAAAVRELDRLFPGTADQVLHTATVAWPNEPYTRGAYMALAPGEVTRFWEPLFTPAGRIYFAGEHAAVIQGYMEGAVESGQRAARTILERREAL